MIFPILPIYKIDLKKQPSQHRYSENRKSQILFKDVLAKEMAIEVDSEISGTTYEMKYFNITLINY